MRGGRVRKADTLSRLKPCPVFQAQQLNLYQSHLINFDLKLIFIEAQGFLFTMIKP